MSYIKNIEPEVNLKLADQIAVLPGQIVSKTLAQNDAVSLTLFALDQGEEISTHASEGDAMVLVLELSLIHIFSYEYDSIETMGSQAPVFDKYNILFVVGTMDPKIKGVEFISLEELIEQKNIEKISELLNEFMSPDEIQQFNDNLLRNFPMENLLNYLTILNPEIILGNVETIIRSIEAQLGLRITSNVKVCLLYTSR